MHENHRARVRERYFAGGLENMDDRAVLEMLLFYCIPRKDTNPAAQLLLLTHSARFRVCLKPRRMICGLLKA